MTWTFIILLALFAAAKILVTCLPTSAVEWIISKFQLHPTINSTNAIMSIDGKSLEGENKNIIINYFNEAIVLEKYYGYPNNDGTPLIIETKKGKEIVRLSLYGYKDHIDVVKKDKKKVIAYRLRSKELQQLLCS
ncbi:YfmQ family protein [Metabacillus fastidiosus]|uniref:YfmQ family protein n=1 Tax=Metabacillus fastidiosus TaxID=1458 RepID=UPI003D2B9FED